MHFTPEFTVAVSLLALAVLVFTLIRVQSALMGLTFLILFSISSASLAGFLWGRICGLPEDWVSPAHYYVFGYSALGVLGFVLGIAIAWRPLRGLGSVLRRGDTGYEFGFLRWANPTMVKFLLGLGVFGSLFNPYLRPIPTLGTAVALLPGLLKLAVLVAIIYWRRSGNAKFFILTVAIFVPLSIVYAMSTGHTPLSMDLALPVLFVIASFSRFSWRSIVGVIVSGVFLAQFMFAWMNARWVIRDPDRLGKLTRIERTQAFFSVFGENLSNYKPEPEVVQALIIERLDQTQYLAMQAEFQPLHEPYQYGRTILEGVYALVPRFLWPDKPKVAGGYEFVAQFTGLERAEDETSIGVPIQFELYANGGPAFVILGLTLLGWMMAWIERQIMVKPLRLPWLLVGVSVLVVCGYGISQVSIILASLATMGGTVYGIGRFIETKMPNLNQRLMGIELSPEMIASLVAKRTERPAESLARMQGAAESVRPFDATGPARPPSRLSRGPM